MATVVVWEGEEAPLGTGTVVEWEEAALGTGMVVAWAVGTPQPGSPPDLWDTALILHQPQDMLLQPLPSSMPLQLKLSTLPQPPLFMLHLQLP